MKTLSIAIVVTILLSVPAAVILQGTAANDGTHSDTRLASPLGMDGNGTENDPYLISSVEDLHAISRSHFLHPGAFYKQTQDMVFDASPDGNSIIVNISMNVHDVIVEAIPEFAYSEGTACFLMNDRSASVTSDDGFRALFEISALTDNNSVTVCGIIDDIPFAAAVKFLKNDELSVSLPLDGNFTPIGSPEAPFSGYYDGNGYSITGMRTVSLGTAVPPEATAAMFSYVDTAVLRNIDIRSERGNDSYAIAALIDTAYSNSPGQNTATAGGIVGKGNDVTMISCSADGIVSSMSYTGSSDRISSGPVAVSYMLDLTVSLRSGGLMGSGNGTIADCTIFGTVSSASLALLITQRGETVMAQTSEIITAVDTVLGGAVGLSDSITIRNTGNNASLFASTAVMVRTDCFSFGNEVEYHLSDLSFVGGIIGRAKSSNIADVYNAGPITVSRLAVSKNYNQSDLMMYGDIIIGGCAGTAWSGEINNFYNAGPMNDIRLETNAKSVLGREGIIYPVLGGNGAVIKKSYFLDTAAPPKGYTVIGNVKSITHTEMAQQKTFAGWDFDRTWTMSIARPMIWVRHGLTIIDDSGELDGNVKYSVDRHHVFDEHGTLNSYTDKNGFSLTLEYLYRNSNVTLYATEDDEKMVLKNIGNRYVIPTSYLSGISSEITLHIEGLVPCYDLTIIDDSNDVNGDIKYSVDRDHMFDEDGTLHSYTYKDGFSLTLEFHYRSSDVTLYTIADSKKIILEKDDYGNYIIPASCLYGISEIILHIEGLELFRYDLVIIEDTDGSNGEVKYSTDREHLFDEYGTLFTYTDKNGFSLTLEYHYRSSDITLYAVIDDEKIVLEKDEHDRYVIPEECLCGGPEIVLHIEGLELFRYDLTIIDDSGEFSGEVKYSTDREHFFDEYGTLFTYTDKNGFSLSTDHHYRSSVVTLYAVIDDEKIILEKDDNGRYIIPDQCLYNGSEIVLHIEGLEPFRYGLTIIDDSGEFSDEVKYSIDCEHFFDGNGTLYGHTYKEGFSLTLEYHYRSSVVTLYAIADGKKVVLENIGNRYVIPEQCLYGEEIILHIEGLGLFRYDLVIIDDSGKFNGEVKYSADREHFFDENGTLFTYTDKNGFSLSVDHHYRSSVVTLYTVIDDEKIILEKDDNGNYVIPEQCLYGVSSEMILHIEGLEPFRYGLTIIDDSGKFNGETRYSIDREHFFDENGTLHSHTYKEGFSLTLEFHYRGSDITLYTVTDGKKITLEKDGGRYPIPEQCLYGDEIILHIKGLELFRYDLIIIDDSGEFSGEAKYAVDREHAFNYQGTLFTYADKNGFLLTVGFDHRGSDITLYTMIGGKKTVLQKINDRYMIPEQCLYGASSEIILHIEGLEPFRYELVIIDDSGEFDIEGKYAVDREYIFDEYGTLYSYTYKNGFSLTLEDDYRGSEISVYAIVNSKKIILENIGNRYVIPTQSLYGTSKIILNIEGLELFRYDLVIIDDSGEFDAEGKYSVDREHFFDGNGTLFTYTDKNGFSLALEDDYSGSEITVYVMDGDERIVLKKDDDNHYMMPKICLSAASDEIILHIDGLERTVRAEMPGSGDDVTTAQKHRRIVGPVQMLVLTSLTVVIAATVCNAVYVESVLRACTGKGRKRRR